MRKVLTFILAGGKGERLNPLTRDRAKPAVPFGGIYRIIDFTLSNCINSGLRRIFILIQYKSSSLQKHIFAGWDIFSSQLGEFIDVIPPQQRIGSDWYKGTADAIFQNMYAIGDYQPKMVLILAGDHIYKMDYSRLIKHHKKQGADMTVCCVEMPKETSPGFGVIEVDSKGFVTGFQEKPLKPKTIPGHPHKIFASMGIYLFNTDALQKALELDAKANSDHDFGRNVIPQMIQKKRKVCVYNFVDDHNRPKYWRDIGTRDAYFEANLDLVKSNAKFNLYDRAWPVRTYHSQHPPIKMISVRKGKKVNSGSIVDSLVAGGCVIKGGKILRSILSSHVTVESQSTVSDSVIMEDVVVGRNAQIRNAIIDKEVIIPPNAKIGYNLDHDRKRFAVTTSGIVIVAKKTSVL